MQKRGKERSQWRTTKSNDFDLFVPFCHRSLLGRLVSHPRIEKGKAYMFSEMISGLIYAMPCIVFVCVYWAFFTSAPCALLRFIEERDRCEESEKQAQAIERIVPRANYASMVRSLVKEGPTTTLSTKRRRSQSSLKIESKIGQLCHSPEVVYRGKACYE